MIQFGNTVIPLIYKSKNVAPGRTLNSAGFQPSLTNLAFVIYTVRIQGTLTLLGGGAGLAQLMVDTIATPTQVISQGRNGLTGTVVVGITLNGDGSATLAAWVNPGEYVRIVTTNTTGTPTFTLETQVEYLF